MGEEMSSSVILIIIIIIIILINNNNIEKLFSIYVLNCQCHRNFTMTHSAKHKKSLTTQATLTFYFKVQFNKNTIYNSSNF